MWSLRRVLVSVSDAPSTPVVVNGAVAGMRLGAQIEQLDLKAADVIVAVDSQLVKTHAELVGALGRARHPAAIGLTIRRGTTEALVRLVER